MGTSWVHSASSLSYCLMVHVSDSCQVPRVNEETATREEQVLTGDLRTRLVALPGAFP